MFELFLITGMVGLAAMYPIAARMDQWLMARLDRVLLVLMAAIAAVLLGSYWMS